MGYKKPKTNVDVVKGIMTFGNPLKQVFIMNAITEAAKKTAFAPAPEWGENAWINAEAWKAAAMEIYEELKAAGYDGK